MKNYIYLIVGIALGVTINSIHSVLAQTSYCNSELWIFLFNNDLNQLQDCVNMPDIQQDTRIAELQNRTTIIEDRIGVIK